MQALQPLTVAVYGLWWLQASSKYQLLTVWVVVRAQVEAKHKQSQVNKVQLHKYPKWPQLKLKPHLLPAVLHHVCIGQWPQAW